MGASAIGSSDVCGGGRGIAPSIVNGSGLRDENSASDLIEQRAKAGFSFLRGRHSKARRGVSPTTLTLSAY